MVAHEYSLTEVGLTTEWKTSVIEHLMDNPALKGNMAGAMNMISARYVPFPSLSGLVVDVCVGRRVCQLR